MPWHFLTKSVLANKSLIGNVINAHTQAPSFWKILLLKWRNQVLLIGKQLERQPRTQALRSDAPR
jgi:hypothetical protein